MIAKDNFINLTDLVIKNFEGGYYHPDMLKKGIIKDQRYASSGETMFGIDRKHGAGALAKSDAWKEFWSIIDKANARTTWKWNYTGGALGPVLRKLTGAMMYPHFMRLFTKYLSPAAQAVVANDERLIVHFSYASWNGEGWFQRFAKPLNDAVAKGITDKDQLFNIALQARTKSTNSLIRQHGAKMASLIKKTWPALSTGGAVKKKFLDAFDIASWLRSWIIFF